MSGSISTATHGSSSVECLRTASTHSSISAVFPAPGAPWMMMVSPPTLPSESVRALLRNAANSSVRPPKNASLPCSDRSDCASHVSSGSGGARGGI